MAVAPSEDLKNRFAFHPATPENGRGVQHDYVRKAILDLAADLDSVLPPGREHAVVLTKLEEAMFWANASIARQP
jgi:hypothetical protein